MSGSQLKIEMIIQCVVQIIEFQFWLHSFQDVLKRRNNLIETFRMSFQSTVMKILMEAFIQKSYSIFDIKIAAFGKTRLFCLSTTHRYDQDGREK
jgi:ABC-type tungstate transport system substrate-binding protein